MEGQTGYTGAQYASALAGEGEYWDNFIAQRLLQGEIPGSIDWRLTFTQFRYNHRWLPFCLGPQGINFRIQEISYLLTRAVPHPGRRVLDLGCGAGWLSLELARRGADVTGIDISQTNLSLARYMAETNERNFPFLYQGFAGLPCKLEDFGSVEYIFADLNTIDLPAHEYDAVVVWDSLHHVAGLEGLLEQVRKTLKPGGIFLGVDHSFATSRTQEFSQTILPWIEDLYSWISNEDPKWFYDAINTLGRQYITGPLAVDYDPSPIASFQPFLEQLLADMLGIAHEGFQNETLAKTDSSVPADSTSPEESPFEDVSAERLMNVLVQEFHAEKFYTICPFIQPEHHIPHYRSEEERIFQHYLASTLIKSGEVAINNDRVDGQWFLFHLTGERPDIANLPKIPSDEKLSQQKLYMRHLEEEIERKNAGINEMAAHITLLERKVTHKNGPLDVMKTRLRQAKLRNIRLPWKRRK